jgi:PAS domain S-box-containing protein
LARDLQAERLSMGAAILSGVQEAMVLVDRHGNALQTNEAFNTLIGSADFEALDENGEPLSTEDSPRQRVARGESFESEFWLADRDGRLRRFIVNGWPVPGRETQGVLRIRSAE